LTLINTTEGFVVVFIVALLGGIYINRVFLGEIEAMKCGSREHFSAILSIINMRFKKCGART
jgi:hypothetical protein